MFSFMHVKCERFISSKGEYIVGNKSMEFGRRV
jgi:hypothetical protein